MNPHASIWLVIWGNFCSWRCVNRGKKTSFPQRPMKLAIDINKEAKRLFMRAMQKRQQGATGDKSIQVNAIGDLEGNCWQLAARTFNWHLDWPNQCSIKEWDFVGKLHKEFGYRRMTKTFWSNVVSNTQVKRNVAKRAIREHGVASPPTNGCSVKSWKILAKDFEKWIFQGFQGREESNYNKTKGATTQIQKTRSKRHN